MAQTEKEVTTNTAQDILNRSIITLAGVLLSIAGIVDLKNIDRTYEVVTEIQNNQRDISNSFGATPNNIKQFFQELHDDSNSGAEISRQILDKLNELEFNIANHAEQSASCDRYRGKSNFKHMGLE